MEQESRTARVRDAEAAKDELARALADVGVLLPSLGLDTVSLASEYLPPLVELGRCHPSTARRMATVLRESRANELAARVREANRRSADRM